MASIYSTGPALLFADIGAGPTFIGTGVEGPDLSLDTRFKEIMNDLFGTELPGDRSYQGQEGDIEVMLNRFNFPILLKMMTRPFIGNNAANQASVPGSNVLGDYGTLMTQEKQGFPLWIFFPRNIVAGMVLAGLIPGFHFFSTFIIGPDKIKPGSGDYQQQVIWKAQRKVTIGTSAVTSTLQLYDHDMTLVKNLPIN
jgi:hypothetical protein